MYYEYKGDLRDLLPKTTEEAMDLMTINSSVLRPPTEEELQKELRMFERANRDILQAKLYSMVERHNQRYAQYYSKRDNHTDCIQHRKKEISKRHKKNKNKKTHRNK